MITSPALLKLLVPIAGVGVIAAAGSAIGLANMKNADQTSLPKNYVIMNEAWTDASKENTLNEYTNKLKCRLEGGTDTKECVLFKIDNTVDKKWIDLEGLSGLGKTGLTPSQIKKEDKALYQVKLSWELINAWDANKSKKLNVFYHSTSEDEIATATPLITLTPRFGIKTTLNDKFRGNMQYFVGRVRDWVETDPTTDGLTTAGKSFKCDLPSTGDNWKNCDVYLFDNDETETTPKAFTEKTLKTPLTKPGKIKKDFHYLIKMEQAEKIITERYNADNNLLRLKVHNDENRTTEATTGIKTINIDQLSPFIPFIEDDGIIFGAVL